MALADVRPGARIGDYAAGSGYFTRRFAVAVGPRGHVYASVPAPLFQYRTSSGAFGEIEDHALTHPNVAVNFGAALDAARYPEPLDVFFIAQNYHDLRDPFMGPVDVTAFKRATFTASSPSVTTS